MHLIITLLILVPILHLKSYRLLCHHISNTSENPNQAMFIVPVDEHEISLITSELKSKPSSGHDELSLDVLMGTLNYFLTPLVHIINT